MLVAPAYLLLLAGFNCTHQAYGTEEGKATFWKKTSSAEKHYLYVDNVEKGMLPFLPDSSTVAGKINVQERGLSLILKPGRYEILAKDSSGNILCQGNLFLKRTPGSNEIKTSWENNKCSVEIVYSE